MEGPVGTSVTASGSTCEIPTETGSTPDTIDLYWDGGYITSASVDATTYSYSATLFVPGDAAPSNHTVEARCVTTGTTTAANFYVYATGSTGDGSGERSPLALALDPTSGDPGASVNATASPCEFSDAVPLSLDGVELTTTNASVDSATYSATFTVPEGAEPGEHTVSADCPYSGERATAGFTVVAPEVPDKEDDSDSEPPPDTTEQSNVENERPPPANPDPEQQPAAPETTDASAPWLPSPGNLLTIILAILVLLLPGLLLLRRSGGRDRAGQQSRVSVRVGAVSTPDVELTESRPTSRRPGFRIAVEPRRDSGTCVLEEEIDR